MNIPYLRLCHWLMVAALGRGAVWAIAFGSKQRARNRDLRITCQLFGIMSQMPKRSAGLLMYRLRDKQLEVFLVHPGGPFFAKKDLGAWSIPKGEYTEEESALDAAKREFEEETGFAVQGALVELGTVKQPSGKIVSGWAFEGDCDPKNLRSNSFTMGGREFPEVDRGDWFSLDEAQAKLNVGQLPFLDRLKTIA
jgi:predicted NUDIX family NTP pyrophosphohydrolase